MSWNQSRRGWLICLLALFVAGCGESGEAPVTQDSERDVEAEQKLAAKRQEMDWTAWKALPLLDDGRIKPIDTFARETCLLVTAGQKWTDPVTNVKYKPEELLLAWMAEPDEWVKKPILRCEFRALRELLQKGVARDEELTFTAVGTTLTSSPLANENVEDGSLELTMFDSEGEPLALLSSEEKDGEFEYTIRALGVGVIPSAWSFDPGTRTAKIEWNGAGDDEASSVKASAEYQYLRADIPAKGLYVSVSDVIDWSYWKNERRFQYRSAEIEERFKQIRRSNGKDEDLSAEDRELNDKVKSLILHVEAFIFASEARNLAVVPGVDPRTLTKQVNTDKPIPPWVTLGSLLTITNWRGEFRPDATVAAFMADSPSDLVDSLLLHGLDRLAREEVNVDRTYAELKQLHARSQQQGVLPPAAYPEEYIAQLAVAQTYAGEVRPLLEAVPTAFDNLCQAYIDADAKAFADASQTLTRELEELAEGIETVRDRMEPPAKGDIDFGKFTDGVWAAYKPLELSERQIEFSHYPPPGSTATELKYNRSKPFRWAWVLFLTVGFMGCLTYMGSGSKALYWSTVAMALFALGYSAWGFSLRVMISQRAPVTNMYETVIWVGFVVAVMGWIFSLTPVFGPAMGWGWRMTGIPLRIARNEAGKFAGIQLDSAQPDEDGKPMAGALVLLQALSTVFVLGSFLMMMNVLAYSDTSFRITELWPDIDPSLSIGDISWLNMATWLLGLVTCLLASWYLPRAVLTVVMGFVLLPFWNESKDGEATWDKLLSRRFFLIPAMFVAALTMMLADFVGNTASGQEVLNPEIGGIAAVLRNNYWLTIHVLTIVSSYGAGALAWGIGNLALVYYLVGRYDSDASRMERDSTISERLRMSGNQMRPAAIGKTLSAGFKQMGSKGELQASTKVRPPRETATLATYNYRVMQVATLLLAAGTILGGLWADVSWGRFWDWDPKEVWALISLLAYLVVLHGRFAGWVGTFGTNVGSVICFQAIIGSWYGVNFLLPKFYNWYFGSTENLGVGLHSYATGGDAGWVWVVGGVGLNMLLVLAAVGRYVAELSASSKATPPPPAEPDVVEEVAVGV